MRFYRRNADARFRKLERRYLAGDPEAFVPYILALRSEAQGQWARAAQLVREAMIATGEWHAWPDLSGSIRSLEQARYVNQSNLRLATVGGPIAAPMLGVQHEDEGTTWFSDGPYVVSVDRHDQDLANRQFDGGHAPPGQRAFVPLWEVAEVHPPPLGIPQRGYDLLSAGYASFGGTIALGEDQVVHVDGPVISEGRNRRWTVESGEHLMDDLTARIWRTARGLG